MKNPQKVMSFVTLILLVGLILFIMIAKQTTESGEKVGYFLKTDETPSTTPSTNLTAA